VTKPNARLRDSSTPFFVNTDALPWIASPDSQHPRRAGVSSFGFGGTNFHVVVEEYERNGPGALPETAPVDLWPAELSCWTSPSAAHLLATLEQLEERLSRAPDVSLRNVAAAICRTPSGSQAAAVRLAVVAVGIAAIVMG